VCHLLELLSNKNGKVKLLKIMRLLWYHNNGFYCEINEIHNNAIYSHLLQYSIALVSKFSWYLKKNLTGKC